MGHSLETENDLEAMPIIKFSTFEMHKQKLVIVLIFALFSAIVIFLLNCNTNNQYITISSTIKDQDDDGRVDQIEVVLLNPSRSPIRVSIPPEYYCGMILIIDDSGVVIVQHSKYFTSLRTGPRAEASVWIGAGEARRWVINDNEFVGIDGVQINLHTNEIQNILSIPEIVWYDKEDVAHMPLIVNKHGEF